MEACFLKSARQKPARSIGGGRAGSGGLTEGFKVVIQHNIAAMNAHRHIQAHGKAVNRSLQRLSSGYRINSAADDAAGLGISERMWSQIRGLNVASRNTQDAISMLQTTEGALQETHEIVQRMRELAVQSSNGTYSDEDRALIGREFEALKEEVERISKTTNYNKLNLLDGTNGKKPEEADVNSAFIFQVGAGSGAENQVRVRIDDMSTEKLGDVENGDTLRSLDILTQNTALKSVGLIDKAINQISSQRAGIGANINRLQHTMNIIETQAENLQAAESRIRDTDIAGEMMTFVKHNILMQAAQAMLAQANRRDEAFLRMLMQ